MISRKNICNHAPTRVTRGAAKLVPGCGKRGSGVSMTPEATKVGPL
jgi:hypothetical protein